MARRTPGFISKRPHRKSRAGCTTCKRKKVKCDESLPSCSYCALRKIDCTYPQETSGSSVSSGQEYQISPVSEEDFNSSPIQTPSWLVPAIQTSAGQLTKTDLELLHQYKTITWRSLSVRDEALIDSINREWIPQVAMSRSYLLYTILSISAAHRNILSPSKQAQDLATVYRHKSLTAYNTALQNITTDNYETLLMTSLLMQLLVPPPELPCSDAVLLEWLSTFVAMTQGLRVLASLKWASGIENLSVFPVFRRELRPLPPPPLINTGREDPRMYPRDGPLGETPAHPNPPAMYREEAVSAGMDMTNLPFRPQTLMGVSTPHLPPTWRSKPPTWQIPAPAFLPPPLMALLRSLIAPQPPSSPLDLHRATLLPALHALSPIFLSLYHYRLSPDVYVRIIVLPTFLTPEFLALVRAREPRALVVLAWWFAFVVLIPDMWWVRDVVPRLLQAASNVVMRCWCRSGEERKMLMDAVEGAFGVVRLVG
ncbi:hypothetical protein K505DRAFT_421922, partial [Melanomma pulvis-pyrius CBS 109.77]